MHGVRYLERMLLHRRLHCLPRNASRLPLILLFLPNIYVHCSIYCIVYIYIYICNEVFEHFLRQSIFFVLHFYGISEYSITLPIAATYPMTCSAHFPQLFIRLTFLVYPENEIELLLLFIKSTIRKTVFINIFLCCSTGKRTLVVKKSRWTVKILYQYSTEGVRN